MRYLALLGLLVFAACEATPTEPLVPPVAEDDYWCIEYGIDCDNPNDGVGGQLSLVAYSCDIFSFPDCWQELRWTGSIGIMSAGIDGTVTVASSDQSVEITNGSCNVFLSQINCYITVGAELCGADPDTWYIVEMQSWIRTWSFARIEGPKTQHAMYCQPH